jgi:pyrroline-5-carboxylate reductase
MAHVIGWYEARGLDPATARALVAGTLRGNAEVLLREDRPLADIAASVATPGGITVQLLDMLARRGALNDWDEGLDAVLNRLSG